MKKVLTLLLTLISFSVYAQQTGSINVGGDFDKFYPVTFLDLGFDQNIATELEIGRSSVHFDANWRGSLIAKFRFHNTRWGNGARFMTADVKQTSNSMTSISFIAGWWDATGNNGNYERIIWLRGGGTTYYYKSNVNTNPLVYDGVQNPLPFAEHDGPNHTFKTTVDSYVNSDGLSTEGSAYFNGGNRNYFAGNVGIGTENPTEKLSVNGSIRSKEIKVEASNWPDYVFKKEYQLLSLEDLKVYIDKNQHLPDMPTESEVAKEGLSLGEMNKLLTKKVEELTLYLIEKDTETKAQKKLNNELKEKVVSLDDQLQLIKKKLNLN